MKKAPYNVGVGVAAFVIHDGKLLMQERTGAHGANTWAPPGGKLDYGEDPVSGITREIKEETGLSINSVKYIGFTNDLFKKDGLHYITLWYVAMADTADARIMEPLKCTKQMWSSIEKIPAPLFMPTENILRDPSALALIKEYL